MGPTTRDSTVVHKCAVCSDAPVNVVQSSCCKQLFCWECLVAQVPHCLCGQTAHPELCTQPEQNVVDQIDRIQVACRFAGCGLTVSKKYIKRHEKNCGFALVQCRNSILCNAVVRVRDQVHHEQTECGYRIVDCPQQNCGVKLPFFELENHLTTVCGSVVVTCDRCNAQEQRRNLADHVQHKCPLTPMTCKYEAVGCGVRVCRAQMDQHLVECMAQHLSLVEQKLSETEQERQQLRLELRDVTDQQAAFSHVQQQQQQPGETVRHHVQRTLQLAANKVQSWPVVEQVGTTLDQATKKQWLLLFMWYFVFTCLPFWLAVPWFAIAVSKLSKVVVKPAMERAQRGLSRRQACLVRATHRIGFAILCVIVWIVVR